MNENMWVWVVNTAENSRNVCQTSEETTFNRHNMQVKLNALVIGAAKNLPSGVLARLVQKYPVCACPVVGNLELCDVQIEVKSDSFWF